MNKVHRRLSGVLPLLLLVCGCAAPAQDPGSPVFARIDLRFEGCSCFEEVRELKQLCRRLYGRFPEVDELRQTLRISITRPQPLDLVQLAQGVDHTHAITRGMEVEAAFSLMETFAAVDPTGEILTLETPSPAPSGAAWRRFRVRSWESPGLLRLSPDR